MNEKTMDTRVSNTPRRDVADEVKATANQVASQVRTKADAIADDLKNAATDAAQVAKTQGRRAVDAARAELHSVADEKKWETAREVGVVAAALRDTASRLRDEDHADFAGYTDQVAQRLDRFSDAMRRREIGDIAGEVEDFARRHSGLFLGGCLAAGLMAARYLKSSADRRTSEHRNSAFANTATGTSQRREPGFNTGQRSSATPHSASAGEGGTR